MATKANDTERDVRIVARDDGTYDVVVVVTTTVLRGAGSALAQWYAETQVAR